MTCAISCWIPPTELAKIRTEIAATGVTGALGLIVRIALPKGEAKLDLSGKFGADFDAAVALLRSARGCAATLGVSFHVGSQCLDPLAWRDALELTGQVIRAAGVKVDVIDVGGGFPGGVSGPGAAAAGRLLRRDRGQLRAAWPARRPRCGRSPAERLVAAGTSVVVQVQARRGDALYINDGVYGSLSDAGTLGFRYPVRLIRPERQPPTDTHDGVLAVRPDLRQRRRDAWAVPAAGRYCRRGLDRNRPTWCLWRLPAHRVQRLRPRADRRGE